MRFFTGIIRATLLILSSVLLNSSIQANALRTKVPLRIEGLDKTLFEDTVDTTGHIVTTASGGTHECDGTNNGAHTTPSATIISAIDDAVSKWDGTYFKEFRDYFITSIEGDGVAGSYYWKLLVNYKALRAGGCQTQVTADDQVLVAYVSYGASGADVFLEASADKSSVETDEEVVFTVVTRDGVDKKPVEGATMLDGAGHTGTTNAEGKATIRFGSSGVFKLKGTKEKTIRSNKVVVTVTPRVMIMPTATAEPGSQTVYLYDAGFKGCNQ